VASSRTASDDNGGEWKSKLPPLVIRAKSGDRDAFDIIVGCIWDRGVALVRRHYPGTFCREDAEDVVQHALISAWFALSTLKSENAFHAWFWKILARKAIAAYRLAMARAIVSGSDESALDALALLPPAFLAELQNSNRNDPFQHLVRTELVAAAKAKIEAVHSRLTQIQRNVFRARFVNLFNETETAEREKLPVGTVRSSTTRIIELLQKEFGAAQFRRVPIVERKLAIAEVLATWPTKDQPLEAL